MSFLRRCVDFSSENVGEKKKNKQNHNKCICLPSYFEKVC